MHAVPLLFTWGDPDRPFLLSSKESNESIWVNSNESPSFFFIHMIYILETKKKIDKNHLEKLASFRKDTTIMRTVTVSIIICVFELKTCKSEPKCRREYMEIVSKLWTNKNVVVHKFVWVDVFVLYCFLN